jgi:hypothetical protein
LFLLVLVCPLPTFDVNPLVKGTRDDSMAISRREVRQRRKNRARDANPAPRPADNR